MFNCPNCGNEIHENEKFCPQCGEKIEYPAADLPMQDSSAAEEKAPAEAPIENPAPEQSESQTPAQQGPVLNTTHGEEKKGSFAPLIVFIAIVLALALVLVYAGSGLIAYLRGQDFQSSRKKPEPDRQEQNFEPEFVIGQTVGNTNGNILNSALAVYADGWLYYCNAQDGETLYKTNSGLENGRRIVDDDCYNIQYFDGWIYYSNVSDNSSIYRIRPDGSGRTRLYYGFAENITITPEGIYFLAFEDDNTQIGFMQHDGSGKSLIYDGDFNTFTLAQGYIYFCDDTLEAVYRIDPNSGDIEKIFNSYCWDINYFNGKLYMYSYDRDALLSMNLDGSSTKRIVNEYCYRVNISEDGWIYYADDYENATLYRIRPDKSEKEAICSDSWFYMLTIAGDYVFYYTFVEKEDEIYDYYLVCIELSSGLELSRTLVWDYADDFNTPQSA
ncbi:DUF5050 domain-containing protein [Eubacteriales bacterium OttesenSCG-928-K08]|nr:DUF5050 domain-containing protein [Eubacteriales bacterium OttesenSCG-928-K08]